MARQTRTHSQGRHRSAAIAVGILYLCGTVAGILSVVALRGGLDGANPLGDATRLGDQLAVGAIFVLIMGLSLAAIPVVMFPILRMTSERLAVGFLVVRGALETATYISISAGWLVILALSRTAVSDGTTSGVALGAAVDVAAGPVLSIVFPIGAAMFYAVLYRSMLVPRWLSVWGLAAIVPYLIVGVLQIFGVANSTLENALVLPMGLQEMVLAVWLIVRGFTLPAPVATESIASQQAHAA